MNGWMWFWTGLLVVGLGVYAGLAVAVAVGGIFDIRSMFRSLDEQHKKATGQEGAGDKP